MKKLTRVKALKEVFPTAIEGKDFLRKVWEGLPNLRDKIEAFEKLNDKLITHKESVEKSKGRYVSKEIQELFEEMCEKASDLDMWLKREALAMERMSKKEILTHQNKENVRDR